MTLEELLQQLPPAAPSMPIPLIAPAPTGPQYGGPSQVTEPPQAPLDPRIIQQYLAAQGPAPTPPAPLGRGQRIANALMGFSAGVRGEAGPFIEQLERPMRIYQAQVENYNANRERLRLGGTEAMLREQERKTERAQRLSDRDFEMEAQREARRIGISDQNDFERFRNDLLAARQKADDERQAAREAAKLATQQKLKFAEDVAAQVKWYKSQGVSDPQQARRLALNDLGDYATAMGAAIPALTRDDNRQLQFVAVRIARMQGLGAGGGTGAGSPMVEVVDPQGNVLMGPLPYAKVKFDNGGVAGFPGASIRAASGQAKAPPGVRGQSPQGFPLAFGQPGGPQRRSEAAPKLDNQQRARFNDIKRHQPGYSDAQIIQYMQTKGWLK